MRQGIMCTVGVLVAAMAASAGASTIYSTGFESPAINPGTLAGQDGWVNGSGAGVSQGVSGNFPRTGSQSLAWENGSTAASFYSVRRAFDGQAGAITAATPLEMSVWMYIEQGSQPNRLYGIYATNSGTATLGSTTLGMTISGDGSVRAGVNWSQTYSGTALHTDASLVGSWIKTVLRYDGVGGSASIYNSSNALVWSTSFGAVTLTNANLGGVNSWNMNLGTDYFALTERDGRAFMDDMMVRVVPTPAGILVIGAGLSVAGVRRRR
ncbi:MAG: hypothetical protein KF866_06420 [Phycisphaeraceae bacterium]|nr:hypothetical protein [Phycisphaeraceae bacterium]MCW5754629.1 hypothetical protein [Phycisphaeraceae bacterium]